MRITAFTLYVKSKYRLPNLDRRKPLFRLDYLHFPPSRHRDEDLFDRFVAEGGLHKEVEREVFDEPVDTGYGQPAEGMRTVTYVLKGEEWRIPAWALVRRAYAKSGWNETCERLELMLQGYEDAQIEWCLDRLRDGKHRYRTILAYLAVDQPTLASVDRLGCRILPPSTQPLKLFSALSEQAQDDEHRRRLMESPDAVAVLQLRAKTAPFLCLVDDRHARFREIPVDRIEALNELIVEPFEIVHRR